MSPKPHSEGLALKAQTWLEEHPSPQPSLFPLHFQNLTRLKRLNLDGNSLSTVPALPTSLQELKLNDNLLQGLQHSSFRGSGSGRPRGQGPEGPGLSRQGGLGKLWVRGGSAQGSLAGRQRKEHQPGKATLASRGAIAGSSQ